MVRCKFLALASLTLAACSQPTAPYAEGDALPAQDAAVESAIPSPALPPGHMPITSNSEWIGEYRIAGINGEPLNLPFGAALTVRPRQLVFDAPCGGYVWDYSVESGMLNLTAASRPDPNCHASGQFSPAAAQIAEAIGSARRAARTPQNGILLSGETKSATLFTQ